MLFSYYRVIFLFFFICWFVSLSYFLGLVALHSGSAIEQQQRPRTMPTNRNPVLEPPYEEAAKDEEDHSAPISITLFLTPREGDQLKMKIQQQTIMGLHYLKDLGVSLVLFDFEEPSDAIDPPSVNKVIENAGGPWQRLATTYNFSVVKGLPANPHGTPFLKPMFQYIEWRFPSSAFIGYLNADILFGPDLIRTLKAVRNQIDKGIISKRALVVGKRTNCNFKIGTVFPNAKHEYARWLAETASKGQMFMPYAMDYFIITPGTFDWATFPDYVIGRPWYDMMVAHIATKWPEIDSIDASATLTAVHQTGTDGNFAGQAKRPDKDWNLQWAGKKKPNQIWGQAENLYLGSTDLCDWKTNYGANSTKTIVFSKRIRRVVPPVWDGL